MALNIDCVALASAALSAAVTYQIATVHYELPFQGSKLWRVPDPPGVLGWLLGQVMVFTREQVGDSHLKMLQEVEPRGQLAIMRLARRERAVLFEPQDVEHVLIRNPLNYVKGPRNRLLEPLIGLGLVTQQDEQVHTEHRRQVNPAFAPSAIRRYTDTSTRAAVRRFLETVREEVSRSSANNTNNSGEEDDKKKDAASGADDCGCGYALSAPLDQLALRIISDAAFRNPDFESFSPAMRAMRLTANPAIIALPPGWSIKIPHKMVRDARSVRRLLRPHVKRVVAASREDLQRARSSAVFDPSQDQGEEEEVIPSNPKAIIDYLAESNMTEDLVFDHCMTFVFAGHDTTSATLTWALTLLARHPKAQEALFEELEAALALDVVPTLETVKALPFLHYCLYETMRVIPPVSVLAREPVNDDVLPHSDTFVPRGTTAVVSIVAIHHSRKTYGEDADDYRPSRWADEDESGRKLFERVSPCGFMPFGAGKRICIGKEFAMSEMLVTLATIIRNFGVSWPEGEPMPYREFNIVTRPRGKVFFHLAARTA